MLDDNGHYQRDALTGIFVMRKEPAFGAAYEMNRSANAAHSLIESVVDEGLERARQVLDPATYAAAWAEGQAMTLEQSLAAALALKVAPTEPANPGGLSALKRRCCDYGPEAEPRRKLPPSSSSRRRPPIATSPMSTTSLAYATVRKRWCWP